MPCIPWLCWLLFSARHWMQTLSFPGKGVSDSEGMIASGAGDKNRHELNDRNKTSHGSTKKRFMAHFISETEKYVIKIA